MLLDFSVLAFYVKSISISAGELLKYVWLCVDSNKNGGCLWRKEFGDSYGFSVFVFLGDCLFWFEVFGG
jgi:hypothetical protein